MWFWVHLCLGFWCLCLLLSDGLIDFDAAIGVACFVLYLIASDFMIVFMFLIVLTVACVLFWLSCI